MSAEAIARDPGTQFLPLTRELYDELVEAGKFEGEHVELLEGMLVRMAPQGDMHWSLVSRLGTRLAVRLAVRHGERFTVGQQGPIAASDLSEPEPDVVVIDDSKKQPGRHPGTSPLIVEVAVTSQIRDLQHKPLIYARADVTEYWVIDLKARRTVVHRTPTDEGYADVSSYLFDVALEVLGVSIRIADLMD